MVNETMGILLIDRFKWLTLRVFVSILLLKGLSFRLSVAVDGLNPF